MLLSVERKWVLISLVMHPLTSYKIITVVTVVQMTRKLEYNDTINSPPPLPKLHSTHYTNIHTHPHTQTYIISALIWNRVLMYCQTMMYFSYIYNYGNELWGVPILLQRLIGAINASLSCCSLYSDIFNCVIIRDPTRISLWVIGTQNIYPGSYNPRQPEENMMVFNLSAVSCFRFKIFGLHALGLERLLWINFKLSTVVHRL